MSRRPPVVWAAPILTPKSVTRASILTPGWRENCTLLAFVALSLAVKLHHLQPSSEYKFDNKNVNQKIKEKKISRLR